MTSNAVRIWQNCYICKLVNILFILHVGALKSFEKQFCRLVTCKDVLLDRSRTNLCSIPLTLLLTTAFLILNSNKYHICFEIFLPLTFFCVSRNRRCSLQLFLKINVLKNFANFTGNVWRSAPLSKIDSNKGAFLSDLWNF